MTALFLILEETANYLNFDQNEHFRDYLKIELTRLHD